MGSSPLLVLLQRDLFHRRTEEEDDAVVDEYQLLAHRRRNAIDGVVDDNGVMNA